MGLGKPSNRCRIQDRGRKGAQVGQVIGIVMAGMLGALMAFECVRYRRAARGEEEMPYPRRRLTRRLAIALLFGGAALLVSFWPPVSAGFQLFLIILVLMALAIGLSLIWRDLRETSRAIMEHANRLSEEAGRELLESVRRHDSADKAP